MRIHSSIRSLPCVCALLLLFSGWAYAQEFRSALTGRVTDAAGAALPGAAVSLKNIETNITAKLTTNAEGNFNFPLLQPGNYTLSVTQAGFKQALREKIVLGVADRLTVDVQLEVGGTTESVTVTADAVALETNAVGTGMVVTAQQLADLPLTEGTAYQLATLAPGIAFTGNPLFNGPTSNGNLAAFRSNGATGRNQITLDGAPNYAFDGGAGFSPPSDAVQQFKVQTNLFDAQQGYTAGGTVNVAVKSGANDLHGSAWYFNRDRSRTANNFFSNRTGQERPERTYHRFGTVLSGPVYVPKLYNGRNRTFFLFSYERLKDSVAEPQLFTVPTAKMRQGDFSDFLKLSTPTLIYDPATAALSGTTVNRTAFANNIIPKDRLNPVAVAYLNFFPQPNAPGNADGTNNYFSNMIRRQNYRAYLTRIDHKISERQTIFGKYFHSFNPEDRYDWAGVVNNYPVTSGFEYRTNDGGNVDYTLTITPTTVLDLRVNFNRFAQERRPAQEFDPAQLGFTPQALAVMRGYRFMPRFDIRTYDAVRPIRSTLGSNRSDYNGGLLRPFMMGSFQPTLTKIFGSHTAKLGYDLRVLRENFTSAGYQGGRFFFDGIYTTPASNSSTALRQLYGRDVAAFLLGIPTASSSQSVIENGTSYSVQSVYHGFYFHDDWRVNKRLTLNLGLRYELELGLTERFNRIVRSVDLTTSSPIEAAAKAAYTTAYNAAPANFPLSPDKFRVVGGITYANADNRSIWNTDKTNWQPRVGASFKLNDKTVVRGGFGIFMAPFQIETPYQVGYSGTTPFVASNDNGRTFVGTLNNPFPNGLLATPGASNGLLTNVGQDLGSSGSPIIPAERRNAKFARLIFGAQRELPGQLIVEANFITAWGYDLGVARNLNFVPRSYLGTDVASDTAANTFLATTIANPF
ncbi:MAG TPA: carboxypeptidase-like regulatory domain-containing protein, partial [Blastocatellia bacterium]|nr:carboxypeptidase-like regulatory domain-containing protein [Blastocatellia bacterium]